MSIGTLIELLPLGALIELLLMTDSSYITLGALVELLLVNESSYNALGALV